MDQRVRVFDLERIFIGDLPWTFTLEIIFRSAFMYFYTLLVIRVIGKRGIRELTLFEYVIIFALGSAVGDPMFYPEIPLLHGMTVVTAFVALHRALVLLTTAYPALHQFVYPGETTCLVHNGVINIDALRKEKLNEKDLSMILREAGIENLGQVRRAYLEPTGEVSVWKFPESQAKPGLPLGPECDPDYVTPSAGSAPVSGRYACRKCGRTLHFESGERLSTCTCRANSWIKQGDPDSAASGPKTLSNLPEEPSS